MKFAAAALLFAIAAIAAVTAAPPPDCPTCGPPPGPTTSSKPPTMTSEPPAPTSTSPTKPPTPTSEAPGPTNTVPPPPPPPTCDVCVPPPVDLTFSDFKYGGSGCNQGTVSINLSPDKTVFTVLYDQFVAFIEPGSSITDSRKNCGVNFLIHVPPGYSCAILFADWRGFVDLETGITGTQQAIYYLAGSIDQRTLASDFTGPIRQNYLFRDVVPEPIFSPCGQSVLFNINSQVRVEKTGSAKPDARGQLTTDSSDHKVKQLFNVAWKKC